MSTQPDQPEIHEPPVQGLVGGKYELVRMIGRGGMGSVWEGRHTSLGTHVAIKFIEAEYAKSAEARKRFDNEARAAATIRSKYAIQIHDHGVTENGRPYIVMELLIGEALDKRIERLGRIRLQDTARIIQQVCRALSRAHESGIVHRDLKPENIFLVRTDDDEETAKVLDFGIAKIKAAPGQTPGFEAGVSSSTKTGAVLGTPYYMSPEQARGLRNIDHRTDLWSLGIIAFKCVIGTLPFDGESIGDLLVKICTAAPPVPSQQLPELPSAFDAWFARALDRDPALRFGSASELSDGLLFAAGLSGQRGAVSNLPPTEYGDRDTGRRGSLPAQMQAAGSTSAPFVSTTKPGGKSRGLIAASLVAVIIGALGVVGWKRMGRTASVTSSASAKEESPLKTPETSSTNAAGALTISNTAAEHSTTQPAGLPGVVPMEAPDAAAPTSAPTKVGLKGGSTPARPSASVRPPAPAAPPALPPPPVRPKPPSGPADPGY